MESTSSDTVASGNSVASGNLIASATTKSCKYLLHTLLGHTSAVYSIAYSPDGQHIASCSEDNTIKIWKNPIYEDKWQIRKSVTLLRENCVDGFSVWNNMTNIASFLPLKN